MRMLLANDWIQVEPLIEEKEEQNLQEESAFFIPPTHHTNVQEYNWYRVLAGKGRTAPTGGLILVNFVDITEITLPDTKEKFYLTKPHAVIMYKEKNDQ